MTLFGQITDGTTELFGQDGVWSPSLLRTPALMMIFLCENRLLSKYTLLPSEISSHGPHCVRINIFRASQMKWGRIVKDFLYLLWCERGGENLANLYHLRTWLIMYWSTRLTPLSLSPFNTLSVLKGLTIEKARKNRFSTMVGENFEYQNSEMASNALKLSTLFRKIVQYYLSWKAEISLRPL